MSRWVAVVGAGPAGLAAAIEAAAHGCRVTVIDEAARPGGQIYRQADPALDGLEFAEASEHRRKHALLERFSRSSGIEDRPGVLVFAIFAGPELHVAADGGTEVLRPDAVVLATGVRELAIPFPGWTLPGVMLAGGAQAILKAQGTRPGHNAVIAGAGPLPLVFAAQFLRAGGTVAALAMLNSPVRALRDAGALLRGWEVTGEGGAYAATVLRRRIPLLTGWLPARAIGSDRLEAVVLRELGPAGPEREIACDLLAVNYGFAVNSELAALAGAQMRRDPVGGGWVPVVDDHGRTSVEGVFSAGDAAGLRGAVVAESDGRVVGAAAAGAEPAQDAVGTRKRYRAFRRRGPHHAAGSGCGLAGRDERHDRLPLRERDPRGDRCRRYRRASHAERGETQHAGGHGLVRRANVPA